MKYSIRKTTRTTARIAFESIRSLDPSTPPEIHRYLPCPWELVSTDTGHILGFEKGKTCALTIHIRRNDFIALKQQSVDSEDPCWSYFRIGQDFQPVALDLPNRSLSLQESAEMLSTDSGGDSEPFESRDEALIRFLAQKHPAWLQSILERQLRNWHDHKPDHFYRFAPMEDAGRDLDRCVAASPFAALGRFKARLTQAQLAICVDESPKGAVMFAIDSIPVLQREDYLRDQAKEALKFAADKLSDLELGHCARIEMLTAFRRRARMENHRRAIMLASSYPISFIAMDGQSQADLQAEVRQSLLDYPDEWRASDSNGFPSILKGLKQYVGISLDIMIITALLPRVRPADQQALLALVAAMI